MMLVIILVQVLLSGQVERFSVSLIPDFFLGGQGIISFSSMVIACNKHIAVSWENAALLG